MLVALSAQRALCQAPVPTAPTPTPVPSTQAPSLPPYAQQPSSSPLPAAPTQTAPPPTPTPPPAIVPAAPSPANPYTAEPPYQPYGIPDEDRKKDTDGSVYIPIDSWVYEAMTRLYSLGYANTMFLSMRPWTRKSVLHMLEESEESIRSSNDEEAQGLYATLTRYLELESTNGGVRDRGLVYGTESIYGRALGITGQTLRDSYHLGETIANDYGRPYQPGFNSIIGFSTIEEYGRFSLYVRGEYQHSPSGTGYSLPLAAYLSQTYDAVPYSGYNLHQPDIPEGTLPSVNPFRLQEASLSFHLAGHEISAGKTDNWLGPAYGGSLAWSNNAEDIYSFRINRVEPLHIPLLSRLLGPVRYDFFYGSLKGHTSPNDDYTDSIMIAFRPTVNFEFGFQRTIIFGGEGHEPVTLHTFLKGFLDPSDTTAAEKAGRDDPGARYSDFNMSWRLPFLRKYVTFVADSIAHDDVTPPSAPRRAAFRTGLYLSQIPGLRKLDARFEAMDTDPITSRSTLGQFNYWETVQHQAYTNQGVLMGDSIGREGKGGQAWLTYHLSPKEWIQLQVSNKKNDKDFGPGAFSPATGTYNPLGGTTQNSIKISAYKRLMHDQVEVNGWFQLEQWTVPAYMAGRQTDTSTAVQITFFPGLKNKDLK